MTASLTLNKITAQKGISVGEAANRVADLGWTPSYVQEAMTFPTDYKISKAPRDPMKQVLRSYFPMQEEKDNRVYGALDAALRGDMFRNVEPRWVEWMKLFLAIIPFPEISAARSMAMVGRLAPGEELRTGFTMQMVDEFRHSTIQMNLKKWYMENYIDPAGFDITEAAFGKCYATTIGRQFAEGFLTGDAITAANVYLTVVAETAFTNTLFVAMPSEAARNGDYALPTVFLSVQSDEVRHIGNGHSHADGDDQRSRRTISCSSAICNTPSGRTTRSSTPRSARSSNTARPTATRTRNPTRSSGTAGSTRIITAPTCCRWRNTASRSTTMTCRRAWDRIVKKNYVHKTAQFFSVGWPVNFWRIEAQTEKDFEWFEHKYPGWYAEFGDFWKWYAKLTKPGETQHPLQPRRRLRLSAPLLELHGALPDPRGLRAATKSTASCTPIVRKSAAGRIRWLSPPNTKAARRRRWAASAAAANGKTATTAGISPTPSRISALSATTARRSCRSRICASTTRTCGRSTMCAATLSAARCAASARLTPERARAAHRRISQGLQDQSAELTRLSIGGRAAAPAAEPSGRTQCATSVEWRCLRR